MKYLKGKEPLAKKGLMALKMGKNSPASLSVPSKGMNTDIRRSINKNDKDMNK